MLILTGKTLVSALRPPFPYAGELLGQFLFALRLCWLPLLISTVAKTSMADRDLIGARMYPIGCESTRIGHIERQLRRPRAFGACMTDRVGFAAATWGD